ncbi:MAG TPA: asparagine synthase (glutamine-hydrolyzing) [Candidatus Krumholzibacteria bacterium]|nr:asparagine synthase (glutamine-hydrolyzing) [Candidatus Krumholzibacteria bacterium]
MCGILGYYNLRHEPIDRTEPDVIRLRDMMAARGPDSCGYQEAPDRSWILAHRRLSIIDLSEQGHQPMSDASGRIQVCYNGEIYNFKELRAELAQAGVSFRSSSDTEVLAELYARSGPKCFARLRGMFAVIIVDDDKRCAVIARDPVGKKPLYYALIGDNVVIASDAGAIARDRGYRRAVSATGLYSLLTMGGVKSPDTLFEGIHKLEPGCYHVLDANFRPEHPPVRFHHFEVRRKDELVSGGDALQTLDGLLDRAVARRMLSDVPFGVYLSGGIDSALIVSYMAQHVDRVNTFSIDLASSAQSKREANDATRVARQFNTNHHVVELGDEEYIQIMDEVVFAASGPAMPDSVLIAKLSQLARDNGVIVIETGEGADEVFFGYQGYLDHINQGYAKLHGQSFPRGLADLAASIGPPVMRNRLSYAIDTIDMRARGSLMSDFIYQPFFSYQARRLASRWLGKTVSASKFTMLNDVVTGQLDDYHAYAPTTMSLLWNCSYRWADLLLDRIDRYTMTSSVEGRAPFLDVDVINFGLSLADGWKSRNGTSKYILRELAKQRISGEHAALPKRGFGGGNNNMLGDRTCTYMRDKLGQSASYRESPLVSLDHISDRSQLFTVTTFHTWMDNWIL